MLTDSFSRRLRRLRGCVLLAVFLLYFTLLYFTIWSLRSWRSGDASRYEAFLLFCWYSHACLGLPPQPDRVLVHVLDE